MNRGRRSCSWCLRRRAAEAICDCPPWMGKVHRPTDPTRGGGSAALFSAPPKRKNYHQPSLLPMVMGFHVSDIPDSNPMTRPCWVTQNSSGVVSYQRHVGWGRSLLLCHTGWLGKRRLLSLIAWHFWRSLKKNLQIWTARKMNHRWKKKENHKKTVVLWKTVEY